MKIDFRGNLYTLCAGFFYQGLNEKKNQHIQRIICAPKLELYLLNSQNKPIVISMIMPKIGSEEKEETPMDELLKHIKRANNKKNSQQGSELYDCVQLTFLKVGNKNFRYYSASEQLMTYYHNQIMAFAGKNNKYLPTYVNNLELKMQFNKDKVPYPRFLYDKTTNILRYFVLCTSTQIKTKLNDIHEWLLNIPGFKYYELLAYNKYYGVCIDNLKMQILHSKELDLKDPEYIENEKNKIKISAEVLCCDTTKKDLIKSEYFYLKNIVSSSSLDSVPDNQNWLCQTVSELNIEPCAQIDLMLHQNEHYDKLLDHTINFYHKTLKTNRMHVCIIKHPDYECPLYIIVFTHTFTALCKIANNNSDCFSSHDRSHSFCPMLSARINCVETIQKGSTIVEDKADSFEPLAQNSSQAKPVNSQDRATKDIVNPQEKSLQNNSTSTLNKNEDKSLNINRKYEYYFVIKKEEETINTQ